VDIMLVLLFELLAVTATVYTPVLLTDPENMEREKYNVIVTA